MGVILPLPSLVIFFPCEIYCSLEILDNDGGKWVGCFEFCDIIGLKRESKAQTIKDQRKGFAHSVC